MSQGFDDRQTATIGDINRVLVAIRAVDEHVTDLRTDLMGRMDRLQGSMTSLREENVTQFCAAEHAQLSARNAQDDVRGLVKPGEL